MTTGNFQQFKIKRRFPQVYKTILVVQLYPLLKSPLVHKTMDNQICTFELSNFSSPLHLEGFLKAQRLCTFAHNFRMKTTDQKKQLLVFLRNLEVMFKCPLRHSEFRVSLLTFGKSRLSQAWLKAGPRVPH